MKALSGHTQPFAVLGHPIGHTLSPIMHNASIEELGLDAVYLAFDVHPDRLMQVLPAMGTMGFKGVNLTVPLKEVAFRGLADLAPSARNLGAVNTVQYLPDGNLRGHNTDGQGFLAAIEESFRTGIKGLKVFVLGSGGAGRAVAITCAVGGARELAVTDLEKERADRLAKEIRDKTPLVGVRSVPSDPASWSKACHDADLVIQATPVGMKREDASLLTPAAFRKGQLAFDLVYMYPETPFMRAAHSAGANAANGLGMLLHQGAAAFTIWTGRQASVPAMRKALEASVYGKNA